MTASSASRIDAPHRTPRRPQAWSLALLASQAAVAALWWRYGATVGLPAMLATHAPFWWGTLWPHSRVFGPVLNRLTTDERLVWLTIDDGPSDDTSAILDALDAHGAKATFFLVGARATARPDLVREIARRGHGVGNHSSTHPAKWFWALGPVRMRREIADTQRILSEILGAPPHWFRAVVGMSNPFVNAVLKSHGLARVAWSARGFDGVAGDPARAVARIERDLSPGAIVLLHEGATHGGNVETIRLLLQRLDGLGYRAVVPSPKKD
ncbi:MAG: polysaccharide deacetylase family protein [Lysobacter sp.]|nr:MAG: polysaccharide deacetylase family protein [Lysobacter sp.]